MFYTFRWNYIYFLFTSWHYIFNFHLKCLVMLWFFKAAPEGNKLHSVLKGTKEKTVFIALKKRKNMMWPRWYTAEGQRSGVIIPGNHNRLTNTDCSTITIQHNKIDSIKITHTTDPAGERKEKRLHKVLHIVLNKELHRHEGPTEPADRNLMWWHTGRQVSVWTRTSTDQVRD